MLEGGILDLIGLIVRRPWVFSGRIHTLKNARPFGFSNFLGSFGRCVFRAEAMAGRDGEGRISFGERRRMLSHGVCSHGLNNAK
jgi:hypothetical protein